MNWQHLRAFVWLRWRILLNESQRGGSINAVLTMILALLLVIVAVPLFIGCFVMGLFVFRQAEPVHLLYAWDAMAAGFLFFWMIGLVTELQRTDALSPAKFLHLPLSVSGVFVINYLSSLVSLRLIICLPILLGFALSLPFSQGLLSLVALPLTLAFLLMVTALTSQFQGWLASLMSNPRRRRTVIVAVTTLIVLISQLPSLVNIYHPWGMQDARQRIEQSKKMTEELAALDREFLTEEPVPEQPVPGHRKRGHAPSSDPQEVVRRHQEYMRRRNEIMEKYRFDTEQAEHDREAQWQPTARLLNMVLPIGWLPLGVMYAAEGNIGPALLGLLGMTAIGATSLWRAYRTTLRLYQGQFTASHGRPKPAAAAERPTQTSTRRKLEGRIPGVSEPVSVIALAGLRSLIRAPEAKMMLMTPVIIVVAFGSAIAKLPHEMPDAFRPLSAIGATALALFGMVQLMANQFGFDRDGFRVFVLCPASRRDILLGKNLSFAPLALAMATMLLTVIEVIRPLRLEHVLSMAPQFVSMYLLFCLMTNLMSIYTAQPIAAGSLRPAHPKLLPMLLQLVMFIFLFPLSQAPTLAPLAVEALLEWQGWSAGLPICLLLALLECAVIVAIYRFVLDWQGRLLEAQEQKILETVTNRAP